MTQNNNVTLKTLTAHELLAARENMCEALGLVDDSERHEVIVGLRREEELRALRARLDALRADVERERGSQA
ncbi:Htl1p [Lachancea thermotolerans CBS 6340]|uniref:KLTH0H13838p n=1 Tax=Lachancea thermotolerans (strain ATCC 56472 / CBS 6340 / NRRL Y-8284) TaxID=559295 RepID=C5E3I5_LACTC|nr:KLTH0H13838p [Lachancea thermotolerans CBS 6340]CAR30596.1 KLTH0H13838p [Lachancea thermotolerans CBS 6340]